MYQQAVYTMPQGQSSYGSLQGHMPNHPQLAMQLANLPRNDPMAQYQPRMNENSQNDLISNLNGMASMTGGGSGMQLHDIMLGSQAPY